MMKRGHLFRITALGLAIRCATIANAQHGEPIASPAPDRRSHSAAKDASRTHPQVRPLRRVVAANRNGRSFILSDDANVTNAFTVVPGFNPVPAFATAPGADLTAENQVKLGKSLVPDPGGTTFFVVTFPPDSVITSPTIDRKAAKAEYGKRLPGLADRFEVDHPGMHQTNTIDYDIVLDGEIWVQFDDGEAHLKQGDVVVQHGTRHAWRNRGNKPATLALILVGAKSSDK